METQLPTSIPLTAWGSLNCGRRASKNLNPPCASLQPRARVYGRSRIRADVRKIASCRNTSGTGSAAVVDAFVLVAPCQTSSLLLLGPEVYRRPPPAMLIAELCAGQCQQGLSFLESSMAFARRTRGSCKPPWRSGAKSLMRRSKHSAVLGSARYRNFSCLGEGDSAARM